MPARLYLWRPSLWRQKCATRNRGSPDTDACSATRYIYMCVCVNTHAYAHSVIREKAVGHVKKKECNLCIFPDLPGEFVRALVLLLILLNQLKISVGLAGPQPQAPFCRVWAIQRPKRTSRKRKGQRPSPKPDWVTDEGKMVLQMRENQGCFGVTDEGIWCHR